MLRRSVDVVDAGASGGVRRALKATDVLRAFLAALMLVSLPMCARPGRPPGGPRDLMPPQVVETSPGDRSQMEEMGDEVVIIFNERISERPSSGTFEQSVMVSPEVPELKVSHRSDGITLKAPEGWRPQQVYRVRVLPVIQDLFQNRMVAPFELVFGTGMGFSEAAIAGIVHDRITGEPVTGVRVTALQIGAGGGDPPLFWSPTDSLGIFAMRWMVPGSYELVAFTDINRNREADPFELVGGARAEVARNDTSIVSLTILRPDTTPPVVGRVEVADSVTLRVTLDDFVAQEESLDAVTVVITSDSVAAPRVAGVVHDGVYQDSLRVRQEAARVAEAAEAARAAAEAAAADTVGDLAADLGADSAAPATPVATVAEQAAQDPAAQPDTTAGEAPPLLPKQEFYILLADSLHFDVEYVVRIEGITNINGVGSGAGTDTIMRAAPPPLPDSSVADSAAVDSVGVVSDSLPSRRRSGGGRRR